MLKHLQALEATQPYTTLDGSTIRELMHPAVHGNRAQSLAEARLAVGARTARHRHREAEEIYFVLAGEGEMELAGEAFVVRSGDTICIPPGTPHAIRNIGASELRFLCCCAPAYRHDDTELLDAS
ncbi:MAG: cupin domain-containing protein [Rhodocyclaceae bacterium]|nr:cupin domain-containing protein [Rhodocyclaceae bacterium]